ncbi:MAG TPA: FecR domain-containing protein, partial [Rhodanobacteraceae bacterium]
MVLADGSALTLNSDSVVQVRYDKAVRRIVLRRGAAFFQVVHNPERPFVVEAGDVSVTDIGTAFAVDRDGNHVAVTVSHGIVKVDDRGDRADKQQYIRRDEQFVAASAGSRKVALTTNEVSRQLAWRKGLLVFEGRPLGPAADEVSRYSKVPVVIDDPTLARAEFVGVFHVGDSRGFANAAARAFNGQVSLSDGVFHVSRQENSPSH